MNRGKQSAGYTIVEALIFLAVSTAMFVAIIGLMNGRQGRTDFTQKSREFEIKLQDLANDVATGYYSNGRTATGNYISCSVSGNPGTILITGTSTNDNQGANKGCIFTGRSLQINPGSNSDIYKQYSLVGRQKLYSLSASKPDVSSLQEAGIAVIAPGAGTNTSFPDLSQDATITAFSVPCIISARGSVTSLTMPSDKPCTNPPAGAFRADTLSFITTFQGVNAVTGNQESGDTQVNVYVRDSSLGANAARSSGTVIDEINSYASSVPTNTSPLVKDPPVGMYLCLESTRSNQYGLLRIGGGGSRFSTDLTIKEGRCV